MHHAHIDKFAFQSSWIHGLDARVKLLITLLYTICVVASPPHVLSLLFCYAFGPFAVLVIAGIPLRFVAKHLLWVCPFMLTMALSCVWFDRMPATLPMGPWIWHTHSGILRALVICGKFILTMSALIALVSTTPFHRLLVSLQSLHVPQVLVVQLGFLYRYIFILIDTAHHLMRARSSRRLRNLGWQQEIRVGTALVGSLLVRSLESAQRISRAMHVRGFTGQWNTPTQQTLSSQDILFTSISVIYLFVLVFYLRPRML